MTLRPSITAALEFGLWGICCVLLALFIASGAWALAAVLLAVVGAVAIVPFTYRALVMLLLLGTPTLFVLADAAIKARGLPVVTAGRALMGLLMLVLLLRLSFRRVTLPPLSTLERCMLALLAVVFVSWLSTVESRSAQYLYQGIVLYFEAFITPFVGYLLGRSLSWRDVQIQAFVRSLMVVAVWLVMVGILQFFFGVHFLSPTYLYDAGATSRATGAFGSPLEYGQVMTVMMLLALLLYGWSTDRLARTLLMVLAVACLGGVVLSLTRAQWLAAIVVLFYVFWRDRLVRGVISTGVLAGVVALALAVPLVMRSDLLVQRVTDVTPIYNRIALWSTAGRMALSNPLFGVGFGYRTFNDAKRENIVSIGPSALAKYALEPGVPHNEFLHVLSTTGLVGFIVYAMVYVNAWLLARRTARSPPRVGAVRARLGIYVQAALIVFAVSGMFAEMWTFTYFNALTFFLLGILASHDPERVPEGTIATRGGTGR